MRAKGRISSEFPLSIRHELDVEACTWLERSRETERLRGISQGLAQNVEGLLGDNFMVQVRYIFNGSRVWFVPIPTYNEGIVRPFGEEPCPKDKWYSTTDIMAFTLPTVPDNQLDEEPTIIFGKGHYLQERYNDPEVQGGKIALIAFMQNRVQEPPNCLDHMHSRYLKQVAYNDRTIDTENEAASLNSDVADFLSGLILNPSEQVMICVNGSEEMKRDAR
jgi:hypothetical protein